MGVRVVDLLNILTRHVGEAEVEIKDGKATVGGADVPELAEALTSCGALAAAAPKKASKKKGGQ